MDLAATQPGLKKFQLLKTFSATEIFGAWCLEMGLSAWR